MLNDPSNSGNHNPSRFFATEPDPITNLPIPVDGLLASIVDAEIIAGSEQSILPETYAAVSASEALTLALSPSKRKAIELLTSGHTRIEAARAAGVNRLTLIRWFKDDAAFTAAYNAWQKDILTTTQGRLLALTDLAVTTIGKAMARGDARTALTVLKSMGVLDRPKPGATDPQEIERQQNLERKKANTAARKEESDAFTQELLNP